MGMLRQSTAEVQALLDKVNDKIDRNEEGGVNYAVADGLQTTDGINYYLPESAPGDDRSHTLATLADIESAIVVTLNTAV